MSANQAPIRPDATTDGHGTPTTDPGKGATASGRRASTTDAAQFLSLSLIWGCSFLLIKLGERSFVPLQVSCVRMVIGVVTLLIVMAIGRLRLPHGWRTWAHLMVAGFILNALPYTLYAYGERHVSSVLAGIWNATTPLFTLPLAVLMLSDERFNRRRGAGLAIGFVGVLIVLGVWHGVGGSASLAGNLMCLAAAASYGLGYPYARRYLTGTSEGPIALATGQLICATLQMIVVSALFTSAPSHIGVEPVLALLALGAFGTGLAYVLNYSLLRTLGATGTSTVTYVIPVFATLAGVIFLSEPVTFNQPLGTVVILLGAAIVQGRVRLGRRTVVKA